MSLSRYIKNVKKKKNPLLDSLKSYKERRMFKLLRISFTEKSSHNFKGFEMIKNKYGKINN